MIRNTHLEDTKEEFLDMVKDCQGCGDVAFKIMILAELKRISEQLSWLTLPIKEEIYG